MIPVLLYDCETWTLNTDLKRQLDVFGNKCLRSIMRYLWNDFVSKQKLLRETESRFISSIVTNVNSGEMGMWHVTQKLIMLFWLFLKGITLGGGGQESAHKICGWGKSILPVGSYLI